MRCSDYTCRFTLKYHEVGDFFECVVCGTCYTHDYVNEYLLKPQPFKPMKIYLAGPMRGYEEFNFPAFHREAARLRGAGHTVFSPAERDLEDGFDPKNSVAKSIDYYMAIDLPEVCKADAVVVLPGWEESQGCTIEVAVGRACKKEILHAVTMLPVRTPKPVIYRANGQPIEYENIRPSPLLNVNPFHPSASDQLRGVTTQPLPEKICIPTVFISPEDRELAGTPIPGQQAVDLTNPKDLLGMKKPALHLVPSALTILVAKVMELGAKKYGPYNWRDKKVRLTVYLSAALRHLLQSLDGADVDEESQQAHEAHAAACMGIILDARANGCLIDDRPTKGAAEKLIKENTEKS